MKILSLIGLSLLLTGCHSIKIGDAKVTSFGQRTTIQELSVDPKTGVLKVKGYNNDQVTGMVELFKAGVEAGKAAAK